MRLQGVRLEEETGVKGLVMEQIATYGDYDRDPRTRSDHDCIYGGSFRKRL